MRRAMKPPKSISCTSCIACPKHRARSCKQNLINEVIDKTLRAGKRTLDLNVSEAVMLTKQRIFTEKMGFSVAYEEDIPIGKYWMNDYVMRKELI